jgi:hypothetical protein
MRGSNRGPRASSTMKKKKNCTRITSQKGQFSNIHNCLLKDLELSMEVGVGKVLNNKIKLLTQKIDLGRKFPGKSEERIMMHYGTLNERDRGEKTKSTTYSMMGL